VTAKTRLGDIQGFMSTALLRPHPIAEDAEAAAKTLQIVAPGLRLSPVQQLEIYREQFWLRHIDALKEDFVTIHYLLGEEGFREACESYLAAYPPRSFTLRDLGDRFADFLGKNLPWSDDDLLHDCARLEWAFVEAFDAPDAPPLDPRSIAEAPEDAWGCARILLDPSVQLLSLSYPGHLFRAEVRDQKTPERPDSAPSYVVVYRGLEKLMYIAIEPRAFSLLRLLAEGTALAPACERVASEERVADASVLEPKIAEWFQAWTSYGWVSRVDFDLTSPRPSE
jgi:hypothetical protein